MSNTEQVLADLKLRFNIEHPSIEECYVHGYSCAEYEMSEQDNPYTQGTKSSEHWLEGWWDGLYGEKPLFSLDDSQSDSKEINAANEHTFHDYLDKWLIKILEISGVIAVSALVGYQLIDLVA